MGASSWAWIAFALAIALAGGGLFYVLVRIGKLLGELTTSVRAMTENTVPLMNGINETISGVNVELARVDTIVAGVQSITATADSLVGVVHTAVSNPLIKLVAYASGAARGVRKLKG